MTKYEIFEILYNDYFKKQLRHTAHECLASYENGTVISGGDNGIFYTHINYYTMKRALTEILNMNQSKNIIVETGCAAHGTKSTLLWDKFVSEYGGNVYSVDLNQDAVNSTNNLTSINTKVTCQDSLDFLPKLNLDIDFLYLDSYDLDFLNPKPSAEHHLKEFNSVKHLLHKGSIVLIDDTPLSADWLDSGKKHPIYETYARNFDPNMAGKGSLVNLELEKMGATKIMHQYQALWKI